MLCILHKRCSRLHAPLHRACSHPPPIQALCRQHQFNRFSLSLRCAVRPQCGLSESVVCLVHCACCARLKMLSRCVLLQRGFAWRIVSRGMATGEGVAAELFEVVDEKNVPTGELVQRGVVHRDGLYHRSVNVILTCGDRVLLQKRMPDKDVCPDMWDLSVRRERQCVHKCGAWRCEG